MEFKDDQVSTEIRSFLENLKTNSSEVFPFEEILRSSKNRLKNKAKEWETKLESFCLKNGFLEGESNFPCNSKKKVFFHR